MVKSITISAPRDIGFFAGDLVEADVDLVVADGAAIEPASLPHPGPIDYWLDLRSIDVEKRTEGSNWRYTLKMLYQNFYDALDARPQEIPAFSVAFTKDGTTESADVQAWTIGVSPLREVAPPVKEDPKDYMRADEAAPLIQIASLWRAAGAVAVAVALALAVLAYDRVWWPFRAPKTRPFGDAVRGLRKLRDRQGVEDGYLQSLLILHRGIDQTDGRRVLADDAPAFLRRHPILRPWATVLRDSSQPRVKPSSEARRTVRVANSHSTPSRHCAQAGRRRTDAPVSAGMSFGIERPLVLALLVLAAAPLIFSAQRTSFIASSPRRRPPTRCPRRCAGSSVFPARWPSR